MRKRRLERALGEFEQCEEVKLTWRSFVPDPESPPEIPGRSTEVLAARYGVLTGWCISPPSTGDALHR